MADVSLDMHEGERWALLGPNGAGKSTLLQLCGAIEHPTKGTVDVLGKRLGRVEIRLLRESIGHVDPRHRARDSLTVEQAVLTGATGTTELMPRWRPTKQQEARALELMTLLGVESKALQPWSTLSQGERGRTLIARALLSNPRILLLDEPSTGLDVAAREQLLTTIDQVHLLHPRLASVLVTHHLEELPTSTTHAVLLRRGRVHASGPVNEVLTTKLVSECFEHPIEIHRESGRWTARARRKKPRPS